MKKIITILSVVTLTILSACSKSDDVIVENKAETKKTAGTIRFDLEDGEMASRALAYDAANLTNLGAKRLVDGKMKSTTFFFEDLGRTMIGYAELEWKLVKDPATGKIKATCKGEVPVYKAEYINY